MNYQQSIENIETAYAVFLATNTTTALRVFESAKKAHKESFGYLGFLRGVWS